MTTYQIVTNQIKVDKEIAFEALTLNHMSKEEYIITMKNYHKLERNFENFEQTETLIHYIDRAILIYRDQ